MQNRNFGRDILLGVAVGDAIGVPVEFRDRKWLKQNPVNEMTGYGTHNQPPGTWSDDSSLTFCLADSLLKGYNLVDMALRFISWRDNAYWTAYNEVFDIGITTNNSLSRLKTILSNNKPESLQNLKNEGDIKANGNGSLMRILPLICFIRDKDIRTQFEIIWDVSALTHNHIRAALACLIYLRMAGYLLKAYSKELSYSSMQKDIQDFYLTENIHESEHHIYKRIINDNICNLNEDSIQSSGYVVHSLEAALWVFLKYDNYRDIVIAAVNLGNDTDTIAAIAGGLASLYYGWQSIPGNWIQTLAKSKEIIKLGDLLNDKYFESEV